MSLYIFDKDKTLLRYVRSHLLFHRTPLKPEEQILRKGVFEKLAGLRADGHQIAIATNQTAVAYGLITVEEAEKLVENCAQKIGGVSAWRFSPYDPHAKASLRGKPNPYARDDETRKPHRGMILEIMEELGSPPNETFMVGNKKVDKKTAKAAGVRFVDEKKFFKKRKKQFKHGPAGLGFGLLKFIADWPFAVANSAEYPSTVRNSHQKRQLGFEAHAFVIRRSKGLVIGIRGSRFLKRMAFSWVFCGMAAYRMPRCVQEGQS